jgi:hypothetical protein
MNIKRLIPKLLVAVMIISFPIFAAVRAAAVGVNIVTLYPAYIHLEILSGALLAVMEGGALYVVSSYWRQFKAFTVYWHILGGIMLVIAFALPFTSTSYFIAAQFKLPVYEILTWGHIITHHLTWLWAFSVAGVPTVLVIGLGIAHGVERELPQTTTISDADLKTEAWGILAQAHSKGTWIYPPTLVALMRGRIDEQRAVSYLTEWYESIPKKPGVKSQEEQKLIQIISPEEVEGTIGRNGHRKGRLERWGSDG